MRKLWNRIKVFFRYRVEEVKHMHVIHPVRVDGKPAKHLEKREKVSHLHVTEGYRKKTTSVTRIS